MEKLIANLKFTHDYWVMLLPCLLMTFDIITGYYNAWKQHKVSSAKMRDGLGKKIAEIIYICVGLVTSKAFGIPEIAYGISIYIISMELISLKENCQKLGLPLENKKRKKLNNEKEVKNDKKRNRCKLS